MSTVMVAGQTSVSLYFQAIRTSTGLVRDGTSETAIAYNTAGLSINYVRERAAMVSALVGSGTPPVTLASASAAWAAWGFVHVGGGVYRVDYPDAAFATGVKFMIPTVHGPSDTSFIFIGLVDNVGTDPRSSAVPDVNVVSVGPSGSGAAQTASDLGALIATLTGYVDTEVAAIKAKTDNLPADPADASDILATLTTLIGYVDTEVAAILAAVDTEVAAIKAKTDALPSDPADASDIAAAFAGVNTKLDTIDDLLDTEVPALTSSVAALTTAVDALPTNAELATALAAADDAVLAAIAALNNLSAAGAQAAAAAALAAYSAATSADVDAVPAAVLAAADAAPIAANAKAVNDVALTGTGVLGDEWGPA